MQLLLTSAAHSNIGQGGDTIIQTQNCVSPCAWVKLIFSVSRIVILAQGPCSLHTQFSKLLDLCVSSLSRSPSVLHRRKKKRICACYPCASHTSVSFKKNHLRSWLSFLCRGHEAISRVAAFRRRNSVILAQVPCNSVQRKIRRQARHEVRTSGPALEGSIVSPLVNTMGGLSGGRRGGDVSGAASAPSLVVARLLTRALALDLACGIRCPPFFVRKAYASDDSSTPRRKSSAMR